MTKLKSRLINYLSSCFHLSETKVYTRNNPFGIVMGENSFFGKVNQIIGGGYIKIGDNSSLGHSMWLGAYDSYNYQKFHPHIIIGNNVRIGNYACITAINEITIENGCLISEYVYISDHYHGFDPALNLEPAKQPLFSKGKVIIGQNTFIGYRATILSGVTIGKNCVIGAHSVVNKSFQDYSMIAGIPAKIIKTYSFKDKAWIEIDK